MRHRKLIELWCCSKLFLIISNENYSTIALLSDKLVSMKLTGFSHPFHVVLESLVSWKCLCTVSIIKLLDLGLNQLLFLCWLLFSIPESQCLGNTSFLLATDLTSFLVFTPLNQALCAKTKQRSYESNISSSILLNLVSDMIVYCSCTVFCLRFMKKETQLLQFFNLF